jgi:RNA polymerase-binding protein DksA
MGIAGKMATKKMKKLDKKKKKVVKAVKKTGAKRQAKRPVNKRPVNKRQVNKKKTVKKQVRKSAAKPLRKTSLRAIKKGAVRKRKKISLRPRVIKKASPKPRISKAKHKRLLYYKNILIAKRRDVMEGIEKLRESAKGTESENISKYYDHPAEYGTDTMDREQYFLFISREEKYLQEIERSLEAIETGEYGTCRVCGKEIDEARLEAVPTTRICITCKMADQKARVSKTDFS